ncbi:NPCBM/NEW2 domain-containing protein [Streptomyces microflavus]|uniref:NPCBM/NEW2 domain-containing protein n=1 Tax=Streptomyces microflavus TaxID=1919 RepID=UPI0036C5163D
MVQEQGSGGDGVVARQEARERKDRLKAEFGGRLRVLLDLTGLSSREFAQRYPAYKDSTVRKYTLGSNLPPWDFLHDLLTEVTRRTDDPAGPHRRTELFTAYRQVLIDTGADVRGSDQNSLLLRLLDGEEALARLGDELSQVRARENQLRTDLADLEEQIRRAGTPTSGAGAADRKRELEEESQLLAVRRSALVERRSRLITELDTCRTHLAALEDTATESGLVPVPTRDGAGQDRTGTLPPVPPQPPTLGAGGQPGSKKRGRRRAAALIGGAVAVVLLAGGGAAVGIWAAGPHDTTGKNTAPAPAPTTPVPDPTTTEPATPTPSTAPPTTAEPSTTNTPDPPAAPPAAGSQSLVTDLPAFEDDGYLSGPQTVNLRDYPDALRVPAPPSCETVATWQLDRTYTTLVTHVGVTDDSPTSSDANFFITVDGKAAFQRTMKVGQSAEKATIDITNAFRITLTINNCGGSGHGAWLNPTISK